MKARNLGDVEPVLWYGPLVFQSTKGQTPRLKGPRNGWMIWKHPSAGLMSHIPRPQCPVIPAAALLITLHCLPPPLPHPTPMVRDGGLQYSGPSRNSHSSFLIDLLRSSDICHLQNFTDGSAIDRIMKDDDDREYREKWSKTSRTASYSEQVISMEKRGPTVWKGGDRQIETIALFFQYFLSGWVMMIELWSYNCLNYKRVKRLKPPIQSHCRESVTLSFFLFFFKTCCIWMGVCKLSIGHCCSTSFSDRLHWSKSVLASW